MEKLILVSPTSDHAHDLINFRTEIEEAGDADSFAGCSQLENYSRVEDWIEYVYLNQFPENVSEGRVPSNPFWQMAAYMKRLSRWTET